jgi:hypothetical protein
MPAWGMGEFEIAYNPKRFHPREPLLISQRTEINLLR